MLVPPNCQGHFADGLNEVLQIVKVTLLRAKMKFCKVVKATFLKA